MAKNGNGEGSIYEHKRNGKKVGYRGAYTVYTAEGPKRRYVQGKTRAEVNQKLTKAMVDRDKGFVFDDENMSVGEYLDRWLSDCVRDSVRQSTFDRDSYLVCSHIKPTLGRIKLNKLSPVHVQAFYRHRLDAGGLSASTVNKIHTVLHKALSQAMQWDLIPRNVTEAVKAPRPGGKEVRPLSPEQAKTLLEAVRGDRLEALYVVAIATGLRQGELLALKWEDVELENGIIRVKRTLTRTGGKYTVGPPKSNRSRSVGLTKRAVEALRTHLSLQLEEMERIGSLYQPGGLVFANNSGGTINPSNLRQRSLAPLLKKAGLPHIRFHDLRHTCATLLLSRNVNPKIVSEMLGHASIAITLNTYSHVLPTMQHDAVQALEEALK